jgi:hypothetical protein
VIDFVNRSPRAGSMNGTDRRADRAGRRRWNECAFIDDAPASKFHYQRNILRFVMRIITVPRSQVVAIDRNPREQTSPQAIASTHFNAGWSLRSYPACPSNASLK